MTLKPRGLAVRLSSLVLATVLTCPAASPPERGLPGKAPTPTQGPSVSKNAVQKFDYSGIGGSVFATGLGDVVVTVHPSKEFISDNHHPYPMTVSLRLGDKEILLGSNRKAQRLQLGRLDRGELRLIARCESGDGTFESGPAERNADGAAHSRVKDVRPGVVEVYFENTMVEGKRNDRREQHWYKDFKMTFTGAVTGDSGVILMLNLANDKDPAARDAARQTLKTGYPMLARQAGIP
jgi:hypothetical protein